MRPGWWEPFARVALVVGLAVDYALLLPYSSFYARLKPVPGEVPLTGDPRGLVVLAVAVAFAAFPVLVGRRYAIGAFFASTALALWASLHGWARVDWWELLTVGEFALGGSPPSSVVALAIAAPALVTAYALLVGPSADLRGRLERGIPESDARRARRATWRATARAGAGAVAVAGGLVAVYAWVASI